MIRADCWVCRYGCDDDPPHPTYLRPPHSRNDLRDRRSRPVPRAEDPSVDDSKLVSPGIPDVVTCDLLSVEKTELLAEVQELRHRAAVLGAIVGLLVAMLRVSERRLDPERLPEGNGKRALLRAIERASRVVPLSVALRIARLSPSRYHGWRRVEIRCELDDRSSSPRSKPTRLTAAEVRSVKEMVESDEHRHFSLRGLALYAQRIGKVVASPVDLVSAGARG